MYVYYSKDIRILHFSILKANIIRVRKIKKEIAKNNKRKTQVLCKKWNILQYLSIYDLLKKSECAKFSGLHATVGLMINFAVFYMLPTELWISGVDPWHLKMRKISSIHQLILEIQQSLESHDLRGHTCFWPCPLRNS